MMLEHLMYKAIFEMSADRVEFFSRLFTKPRPAGLSATSSALDIVTVYWTVRTDTEPVYRANLAAIQRVLVEKHRLPLSSRDLEGIDYVYHQFYWYGPAMTWTTTTGARQSGLPTFGDLMKQTDATGRELSFLATEVAFAVVKGLQGKESHRASRGRLCRPEGDSRRRRLRPGPAGDGIRLLRLGRGAAAGPEAPMVHVLLECCDAAHHRRERADSSADGVARGKGAMAKAPSPAPPILVPIAAEVKNCALPR